jgi:hypothetical protein
LATEDTTAEGTEVAVVEGEGVRADRDVAGAIAGLNDSSASYYTSIKGTDLASRKAIAKAMTASKPIADNLGTVINLKDIIVQYVEVVTNQETGEVSAAPRVTLIDAEGNGFHATSDGLLTSIRNLFASVGEPDSWIGADGKRETIAVTVTEERSRSGFRYMTINVQ